MKRDTQKAFELANEALKRRAETVAANRSNATSRDFA